MRTVSQLKNILALGLWLLLPLLETAGQICLKLGGQMPDMPFGILWIETLLVQPLVILSLLLDALNFLVWMALLRRHPISFAFPLTSLCYITIILASRFIFHEPIHPLQIMGVLFIMVGVVCISSVKPEKEF